MAFWRGELIKLIARVKELEGFAADAGLVALAAFNTNGILVQTANNVFAGRTLTGTAGQITVANGNGVSGNPTLSLPADVLIPTVITVPNTGLHLLDTNASHDLIVKPGSDLAADRTFTLTTGDADRTLDISAGSVTISAAGATLIDDADAAAQRATLVAAGTAVSNTFSATQSITSTSDAFIALSLTSVQAGPTGPRILSYLDTSSPAANDVCTVIEAYSRDSANNFEFYGDMSFSIVSPTSTTEQGRVGWRTVTAGSVVSSMELANGLIVGAPTGSFQGTGTINATEVYNDSVALTCMALAKEFQESKTVDLAKWDAMVPDIEIPETRERRPVMIDAQVVKFITERARDGSLVRKRVVVTEKVRAIDLEPVWDEAGNGVDAQETQRTEEIVTPAKTIQRVHGTARVFKTMIDSGFDPRDPEQYFARMQADEALPGMPTQAGWIHNGMGMGELFSRKWLAMEMQAIVTNAMWLKLKEHDARLTALEAQPARG